MTLSLKLFDVAMFPSLTLVTGTSFTSIHVNILPILELWQFSFIKDWPEIWRLEMLRLSFAQNLETGSS